MGILDTHRKSLFFCALGTTLLLTACSTVHDTKDPEPSPLDLKKQILELQKSQSQQRAQIEDLNNKIAMLSANPSASKEALKPAVRVQPKDSAMIPFNPTSTRQPEVKVNPLAPVPAPQEITNVKAVKDPAFKLYDQVVADCKKPKLDDAQKSVALMLKKYKDSSLASNALYLYADTLYDHGNYAKSADEFERLYKLYPDGNKAVGALYKLAVCYQKLGHPSEATQAFENIVALYPGSREALEAEKQIMNGQENSQ